jgi:hypothetical protein
MSRWQVAIGQGLWVTFSFSFCEARAISSVPFVFHEVWSNGFSYRWRFWAGVDGRVQHLRGSRGGPSCLQQSRILAPGFSQPTCSDSRRHGLYQASLPPVVWSSHPFNPMVRIVIFLSTEKFGFRRKLFASLPLMEPFSLHNSPVSQILKFAN